MARTGSTTQSWTGGQYSFAQVPSASIPRSVFNRSCGRKQTFDSGLLTPIFADLAYPGDTFSMRCTSFIRMTTPIFPIMDNVYADFFWFAVPIRLVWNNFHKFMGERDDPDDEINFTVPQFVDVTTTGQSLSDYLGIPPIGPGTISFNSIWHRAYNLIWNEWFRAQDLQDSVVVDKDDGPDSLTDYVLLRRGKRHDYFTSALPYTQKGDPVQLPLGTRADIRGFGLLDTYAGTPTVSPAVRETGSVDPATTVYPFGVVTDASTGPWFGRVTTGVGGTAYPDIYADLSTATAATINEIREAFQVQKLLERDARGGTRYTEIIRSHFGVVSPDARLQRPEYLGGGSQRLNIHPVAKTNITAGTSGADLSAFVTSSGNNGWTKSFTEHTLILGMVEVRADLTYQQGINRMFSYQFRYDFYWPEFAHLGEQAVLNKEIYADGGANDELVFGYQERYAEMRYKPSETAGKFRSQDAGSFDKWHLALDFATLPALNSSFIQDNSPFARVVAVTTEPQFYGDFWFQYRCARPMPTFSVPGLIDHF